jgi:hypothetical protein
MGTRLGVQPVEWHGDGCRIPINSMRPSCSANCIRLRWHTGRSRAVFSAEFVRVGSGTTAEWLFERR